MTEAKLLDAAVEPTGYHKSSVGRPDMAHWPNVGTDIDLDCLDHAILQGAHCCANGQRLIKLQTRVYSSTC